MRKVIRATPLYKFLRYCNSSPLDKTVLDCGAGGVCPPLQIFSDFGYETYGVEICGVTLNQAQIFCRENNVKLELLKGDMRKIPFKDEAFSFVFSWNAIHMMLKEDIALAVSEIERVMRSKGLCFVNFVSSDEPPPTDAVEMGKGEFLKKAPWTEVEGCPNIDSYFDDNEADVFFSNFEIIHKEKRIVERTRDGKRELQAYIDYIAKKQ